ncbi:unnamed protein product [Linum tenue]|uniref:EGF-like domain-containing protein n=1 Tax=Linum tenue TaxID=586396 RepID=A0AAV0IJ94_9ROSI|nr:unnamed protein product [Linum tenue]
MNATILLLLLSGVTSLSTTYPNAIHGDCSDKCGNITVPYPFGIGDPKCAFSDAFLLNCTSSTTPPHELLFGNIPVTNISLEEGTLSSIMYAAYSCYDENGLMEDNYFNQSISLGEGPFRFSDAHNKLTVFGCDAMAIMTDAPGNFGSACISFCNRISAAASSSVCSGIGCCQSLIPQGLKTLDFTVERPRSNQSDIWESNPCVFAFLGDDRFFDFGGLDLAEFPDRNPSNLSTAIEWVVEEKHCEEARLNAPSSYACREDSDCVYSENGNGYRCLCKPGFRGNPYLGCQGKIFGKPYYADS